MPNLTIDSHGALMYVRWFKTQYISSATGGVPWLYYIKNFHDVVPVGAEHGFGRGEHKELTSGEKRQHANLLQMTKYRRDGEA